MSIRAAGGNPPDLPPFPRPETAQQRVNARRIDDQHLSLVERLTPKE